MFHFIMKMYARGLPSSSQAMQVRAGKHAKLLKIDKIYFKAMGTGMPTHTSHRTILKALYHSLIDSNFLLATP